MKKGVKELKEKRVTSLLGDLGVGEEGVGEGDAGDDLSQVGLAKYIYKPLTFIDISQRFWTDSWIR